MPRSQGFARGDIDTAFPLDDKFLALRGRLTPDRYYAATGVYFTVVAATWREADRKVALRVAPDAADLIEELVAVGLLGDDGRLPTRVFTAWVGRARRQRKSATDRQARNRAGMSRVTTRDSGVTNAVSPPRARSAPLGTEGTDPTDTGGAGGFQPDAAVSLHIRTGRFPSPKVISWLDDLAREAGAGDTEAGERRLADLIESTPMGGTTNVKDYLTLITDTMRRANRAATRSELADEAERTATKHQPVRLVSVPDDTTPEEADRLAAEWEAKYGRPA